jgi:hypothetical protein
MGFQPVLARPGWPCHNKKLILLEPLNVSREGWPSQFAGTVCRVWGLGYNFTSPILM